MARQPMFSELAVEAGLWFILASVNTDLIADDLEKYPTAQSIAGLEKSVGIDPQMKADVQELLKTEVEEVYTSNGVERFDDIWVRIVLGKKLAQDHPNITIASALYERTRKNLMKSRGSYSAQGLSRWPATCQTLTKRFEGSWNGALQRFGLGTATRGRARGCLKYTPHSYLEAAVTYVKYCRSVGKTPTVNYYVQWVAWERKNGRDWPSAAAQRQAHGTWSQVMAKAEAEINK